MSATSAAVRPLTVVVHGASGTQGAPVARRLLAAGHQVRAVGRPSTAERARARVPAGADPVSADLGDVDALTRAYTGADAVVVHLHAGAPPGAVVPQAHAVLAALARAGVPRAVFNAGGAVWPAPVGVPFLDARTVLAAGLRARVAHATVVGPAAAYMENLSASWVAARLRTHGELAQPIPAEAPVPWLALDDLADAVADVLADPEPPARLVLAGPEALTGADVAATLADVLGRPVRWTAVPFAEHRRHVAEHLGADYAAALAAVYGPGAALPPPPAPPPGALRRGRTSLRAWAAARRWDG